MNIKKIVRVVERLNGLGLRLLDQYKALQLRETRHLKAKGERDVLRTREDAKKADNHDFIKIEN